MHLDGKDTGPRLVSDTALPYFLHLVFSTLSLTVVEIKSEEELPSADSRGHLRRPGLIHPIGSQVELLLLLLPRAAHVCTDGKQNIRTRNCSHNDKYHIAKIIKK